MRPKQNKNVFSSDDVLHSERTHVW